MNKKNLLLIYFLAIQFLFLNGCNSNNVNISKFTFGNYILAQPFSEGLALVKSKNGLCYIDKTGKCVISLEKDVLLGGDFSEGKTWIKFSDGSGCYIEKNGERLGSIIPGFAMQGADNYKDGLVVVTMCQAYGVNCFVLSDKGLKSDKFKEFINYGEYGGFYDGMAWFTEDGNLFGYLNLNGEIIIEQKYIEASHFFCDRAKVIDESGIHIIDKIGEVKFTLKNNETCEKYCDDIMKITCNNGIYYIDKEGNKLFNKEFIFGNNFSSELATIKYNDKISVINNLGEIAFVVPKGISEIGEYSGDFAKFKKDGKYGIINRNGKIIIKESFDSIKSISENFALCEINSQWGFVNLIN